MLLFSALLTQHAHSVMDKDNILSVYILISFFFCFNISFLIMLIRASHLNKFMERPQKTSLLCFVHTSGVMKLFRLLISALLEMPYEK